MKNPTVQKFLRIATIGGSSLLIAGSVYQLFKVKSVKEAIIPALTILVAGTAFSYAISNSTPAEIAPPKPADNSGTK